jgi:hypothetical protein
MGIAIATFFETTEAGSNFMPIAFTMEIVFCGFFVNLESVPVWMSFLEYTSSVKYVWGALMLNEMETFDTTNCEIPENCDIDSLNIDFSLWTNIGLLLAVTSAMHMIAQFIVIRLARKIRS